MKYLIPLLLTGCFFFSKGESFGQETKKNRAISLKFYKQIVINNGSNVSNFSISNFSPAINLTGKKGHFHELEISALNFDKIINKEVSYSESSQSARLANSTTNKVNLGLRYSFNFKIAQIKNVNFYLGTGTNLYNNSNTRKLKDDITGEIISSFNQKEKISGINLNITPRIVWNISNKWFLDLNLPVSAFNFNHFELERNNIKLKNNTSKAFPNNHTVNVGIGFKF